ncbi:hypothetical protein ACLOJK_039647 [Asimina triloba]
MSSICTRADEQFQHSTPEFLAHKDQIQSLASFMNWWQFEDAEIHCISSVGSNNVSVVTLSADDHKGKQVVEAGERESCEATPLLRPRAGVGMDECGRQRAEWSAVHGSAVQWAMLGPRGCYSY